MQKATNRAIAAYGHGTIRMPNGVHLAIGGSTGGKTREFLDERSNDDKKQLFLSF